MPDKENNILTTDGFIEEHESDLSKFPTKEAAFNGVNKAHKKRFGIAKYKSYNSFRNVRNRKMKSDC